MLTPNMCVASKLQQEFGEIRDRLVIKHALLNRHSLFSLHSLFSIHRGMRWA